MKRIETRIDLPATPSVVWKHLQDTSSFESWNPFITSLTGDLEVGQRLEVRIVPVGGKPMTFRPRVTVMQRESHLEWRGTLGIPGLFDGRHSFTLSPTGVGATRFVQAEEFSGVLIPFTGKLLARTKAGFEAMNAALLTRLELNPSTTSTGAMP
jgi:hypothetical protein